MAASGRRRAPGMLPTRIIPDDPAVRRALAGHRRPREESWSASWPVQLDRARVRRRQAGPRGSCAPSISSSTFITLSGSRPSGRAVAEAIASGAVAIPARAFPAPRSARRPYPRAEAVVPTRARALRRLGAIPPQSASERGSSSARWFPSLIWIVSPDLSAMHPMGAAGP